MTCYGERKGSYQMCHRLHEREDNFPLNSADIMTKKLILVAKEAQLERRVACGWNDIKIVACPMAGLFNY